MQATSLQVPFVDLGVQFEQLKDELIPAMMQVIESNGFILGSEVSLFEQAFAEFCSTEHAIGVDSGTAALKLILQAYDIGPGDEVITTANTFIATALAASHVGARPVLVDIDPQTYTMDVNALADAITPRTKVVIPVHLYGQPADMDAIRAVADRHGLIVVEDACQAHGARYKGQRTGSLGDAAAFSFYPAKNLGAFGDGGMITTNDADIAEKIRKLRNMGQAQKYHHELLGDNHRLDSLHAAVLRVKLKYLDEWNAARSRCADLYKEVLADLEVVTPSTADQVEHVWHLYVIRSANRDDLRYYLSENHISTGIHYPIPIHLQPAYSSLGYPEGAFPVTEEYANEIVSLPMYAGLTEESINYVADQIRSFENSVGRQRS
jgi:dTDP-4-amino-4,6-dideoxygalactose transaminase